MSVRQAESGLGRHGTRLHAGAGGARLDATGQELRGGQRLTASQIAVLMCLLAFSADAFGTNLVFLLIAFSLLIAGTLWRLGSIPLSTTVIMLTSFSVVYSMQTPFSLRESIFDFAYPIAYLVGLIAVQRAEPLAQFRRVVLVVVAGATLHGVLNAVTNISTYGWTMGVRTPPDFWTQEPLTATLQATLFIPLVGFAYYGLGMRQERRLVVALFTSLALFIAVAYNLWTASRTIYMVMLLAFLASMLVLPRRLLRLLKWTAIVLPLVGLYRFDIFGVRTLVESSAFMDRVAAGDTSALSEDPRFERWGYVLDHFWENTAGGLNFRAEIGYAHNLWLDAYDVAGLFALLLLLGFTIGVLVLLVRTLVLRELPIDLKVLVAGLWVAFFAQFMTEPILDGMPTLFAAFCVLCGALEGMMRCVANAGRSGALR